MANIKRLLNKKGWTGRELGIIELTNMAITFKQSLEGKKEEPIIDKAQFQKMIDGITDSHQGNIYNGYIAIHEWIGLHFNIAQTHFQQAQLQYRSILSYIKDATIGEELYRFKSNLPAIMTQKQYDDLKKERIEAQLQGENGEELASNVFNLIERALYYYLRKLEKEPKKANPLKAIRKKYVNAPVKSKIILSKWNEAIENGYYTLEDGSGRRSDQMSKEEWLGATLPPIMLKIIKADHPEYLEKDPEAERIRMFRVRERAKLIFEGYSSDEADKLMSDKEDKLYGIPPKKWHLYEDPPSDLTKWDVIEAEALLQIYPADLDGSGDAYSEDNFNNSMKDFVTEFKDLVEVLLKDIDGKYFKGEEGLSSLPIEKWIDTAFDFRQLYEKDFYGEKAFVESDTNIFNTNRRALFNGVAILRPSDLNNRSLCINDQGYYEEPDTNKDFLRLVTLEAFFSDTEDYAENVERLETSRKLLKESYYHVRGYNLALDLIADYFDVPDIEVFKLDISSLDTKIDALNGLICTLYTTIDDIDYSDPELKKKKLQVLRDFFRLLTVNQIDIPDKNKEEAKLSLENFKTFRSDTDYLHHLLCVLPPELAEEDNN